MVSLSIMYRLLNPDKNQVESKITIFLIYFQG